ncbi:MAG TPA: hypothetical protein VKA15_12605 [Isosphaeraceae bacterium]|nr:hypothetical protein [Isosphaeraceae bacterium]
MHRSLLIGWALLSAGFVACTPPDSPIEPGGKLTLTLSRQPAANEMLVVQLKVGVLERGTRIVVRAIDQEIAGTIAPFGIRPGQKAGLFTVPVPGKAIANKKVSLLVEVLEKGAKAVRAATKAEIEDAKLVFIPVAERVKKGKP